MGAKYAGSVRRGSSLGARPVTATFQGSGDRNHSMKELCAYSTSSDKHLAQRPVLSPGHPALANGSAEDEPHLPHDHTVPRSESGTRESDSTLSSSVNRGMCCAAVLPALPVPPASARTLRRRQVFYRSRCVGRCTSGECLDVNCAKSCCLSVDAFFPHPACVLRSSSLQYQDQSATGLHRGALLHALTCFARCPLALPPRSACLS